MNKNQQRTVDAAVTWGLLNLPREYPTETPKALAQRFLRKILRQLSEKAELSEDAAEVLRFLSIVGTETAGDAALVNRLNPSAPSAGGPSES